MTRVTTDAPGKRPGALLRLAAFGLAILHGCAPPGPLEVAGVEVRPPDGWSPVARDRWPVPGTPLAAWAGPSGSSLVVYRTLPAPTSSPIAPTVSFR